MNHVKRRKSPNDAKVDMTPMLDIVFIMLIFFIVTAIFLDETALDFANQNGNSVSSSPTIQIFVDGKDRVSVDRVRVHLNNVTSRVEHLLAEKPNADILVLADRRASLEPIVYIKDQMNQAGHQSAVKVSRSN